MSIDPNDLQNVMDILQESEYVQHSDLLDALDLLQDPHSVHSYPSHDLRSKINKQLKINKNNRVELYNYLSKQYDFKNKLYGNETRYT